MNRPKDKNGYILSRKWFDFAHENPSKVKPNHAALYFWLCELNNRLDWKEEFGLPSEKAMEIIGVRNHRTYKKAFESLVEWGFVKVIERTCNQHTATIISLTGLVKNTEAPALALVKNTRALSKHIPKQVQGTAHIDKQINNKTKKPLNLSSEVFTPDYKPINNYDSISYRLWRQVYDNLLAKGIEPKSLLRTKIKEWTNEVRLMIEKDGRTENEINELINFLARDPFWANNIKSTSKLREKFEDLLSRARTKKHTSQQMSIAFRESEQNYQTALNDI